MKHSVLTLLLLALASTLQAQELPEAFVALRSVCLQARKAYAEKDAEALSTCVLQLDSLQRNSQQPLTRWVNLQKQSTANEQQLQGHLLFDVAWMDSIVGQWLSSTSLIDKSTPLRNNGLKVAHLFIPAQTTQTFTANGRGRMSLMVIAEDDTALSLKVDHEACAHHAEIKATDPKGCLADTWQAQPRPQPMTPYTFQITNPSNHDVVCAVVSD